MTHISKAKLDKGTYNYVLDSLDLLLGKLKKDEVRLFLYSLMSGTERLMVSKRFAAIALLQQKVSVSEVARRLNITRPTVNRLNRQLNSKDKGFTLARKKLQQEKLMRDIRKLLIGVANEMGSNSRIRSKNY